jgi:hypothetical protein
MLLTVYFVKTTKPPVAMETVSLFTRPAYIIKNNGEFVVSVFVEQ